MADTIRRLITMEAFTSLHNKLEDWMHQYYVNSWDTNVLRGIELLNLNARLQSQILSVVQSCAHEGLYSRPSIKDQALDLREAYDYYQQRIEFALQDANRQMDLLRLRLEHFGDVSRDATTTLDAIDGPLARARSLSRLSRSASPIRDLVRARSPSPSRLPISRELMPALGNASVSSVDEELRMKELIARYSDTYFVERLDVLRSLNILSPDYTNNERIIYNTVTGAFEVARTEFTTLRSRVRADLALSYAGPLSLESASLEWIRVRPESLPLEELVMRLVRHLRLLPAIYLPAGAVEVIESFARKIIRLAWDLQVFLSPVYTVQGLDGEFFDESRYRRSNDSDFSAPLVGHFVWPALVQGSRTLVRGEATTRLGATYKPYSSRY